MSEDVKENIQYEVQNVEYRQLVHELQNRLSNEDESKLIQLWNEYCSIQQDYDSQIRLIDWDEMAELFGVSNLIKYVINNQVSENDEYYSIDGNGHIKMFSSIVYSEESPMNLKEIAEKYSKTTAQVMLRWQLQRGIVSLSKSANPERVRQNFDIFDFELSAEDMDKIAALNTNTTVFSDHHEAKTVELLASFVGKSF